jgi:hypothetical protein
MMMMMMVAFSFFRGSRLGIVCTDSVGNIHLFRYLLNPTNTLEHVSSANLGCVAKSICPVSTVGIGVESTELLLGTSSGAVLKARKTCSGLFFSGSPFTESNLSAAY